MAVRAWADLDAELGVPLVITAHPLPGHIATRAQRSLVQRHGVEPRTAMQRTSHALAAAFGVDPRHVAVTEAAAVLNLHRATSWLAEPRVDCAPLCIVTEQARRQPTLRVDGSTRPWHGLATDVGRDAAIWALALSASKAEPYVIGTPSEILATRTDANPLSLVRRAHAALARRLDAAHLVGRNAHGVAPAAANQTPDQTLDDKAEGALLIALALADRASYDAVRTHRPRPLALALGEVARSGLAYLEKTPVTRTNLPLSEAARRVLADALDAAQIAAPVPY